MGGDLNFELNRLAGTTNLDAAGAANVYAGTVGKELVGALNAKAGTSGLELVGVANKLAGTTGLDLLKALQAISPAFVPTSIANLAAWYDASQVPTLTSVAGRVSQWNDLSGSGSHLLQGTNANEPLSGTDTINGRNVLKFDKARPDRLLLDGVTIAQPLTVLCVVKGGTAPIQILGNFTNPEATIFDNGGVWSLYAGSVADTATAVDTNAHQLSAIFNGASSKLFLDAADLSVGNPGTAGRTSICIGTDNGTNGWVGDIAEVLIYSVALSTANRQTVQAYLKTKWATP